MTKIKKKEIAMTKIKEKLDPVKRCACTQATHSRYVAKRIRKVQSALLIKQNNCHVTGIGP